MVKFFIFVDFYFFLALSRTKLGKKKLCYLHTFFVRLVVVVVY